MILAPTLDEFLAGGRRAFDFLVADFGYTPAAPGHGLPDPYELRYQGPALAVDVRGTNWGFGVQLTLRPTDAQAGVPAWGVPFWAVAALRCPDALARTGQLPGQLARLDGLARLLREHGADLLRGDLSVLPAAQAVVMREAAAARQPAPRRLP